LGKEDEGVAKSLNSKFLKQERFSASTYMIDSAYKKYQILISYKREL
jgi:hypothetical protein